ncbi:hypothetical protein [Lusitaniella coriacea]|uniref:hypothetical protein n=1 Tax=Lusitaniella coriacea TaxID=1983105 RepID=UPI001D14398F|nr:hypothetical protein [Lusitaniella coriacea]
MKIAFVDTAGLHGATSYQNICSNTKVQLEGKELFNSEEKSRMNEMLIQRPKDFETYALGDLEIDKVLTNYCEMFRDLYLSLGLGESVELGDGSLIEVTYYRQPKLTIGGTVKNLFEAALASKLGVRCYSLNDEGGIDENYDWVKEFNEKVVPILSPNSAQELRQFTKNTKALLAKVQGGRCRNNKPLITHIKSFLCDIDISGCYGEGQRNQEYPIGRPEIYDFRILENNYYPTLFEWMKMYGVGFDKNRRISKSGDLIPGLWMARISTEEPLSFSQDVVETWTSSSKEHEMNLMGKFIDEMSSDTECEGKKWVDFDTEYGALKINHHEVFNGVLTHDLLQVLLNHSTESQRIELLKKIKVTSSMVYPKSERISCETQTEGLRLLKEGQDNWKYKNTAVRMRKKNHSVIRRDDREYHGWFSVNLGDLLIDQLLIERKKAKKKYGDKSSQQTLYKLCVNTLYGDMVSRFFVTSNPVVGNNITSRARALAWCMEKGLNGWQSITDGCAFEVNKVPAKAPNLAQACDLQKLIDRGKIPVTPLGGENSTIDRPVNWLNEKAWEHLSNLFPKLDVFKTETFAIGVDEVGEVVYSPRNGQFTLEVKSVHTEGTFHGSANYKLKGGTMTKYKMRGYENERQHTGFEMIEGKLVEIERYRDITPSKAFLDSLSNPHAVPRQSVAVKTRILKLSEYQENVVKFRKMGLEPGDNYQVSSLFSEFSLSQFTFKNHAQYRSWANSIERQKLKYGQSIEPWFENKDGTLNYQKMVEWVFDAIERNVTAPFKELDPYDHRTRDKVMYHPGWEALQKVRETLGEGVEDNDKIRRRKKKRKKLEPSKTRGESKTRRRKFKVSDYMSSDSPSDETTGNKGFGGDSKKKRRKRAGKFKLAV